MILEKYDNWILAMDENGEVWAVEVKPWWKFWRKRYGIRANDLLDKTIDGLREADDE